MAFVSLFRRVPVAHRTLLLVVMATLAAPAAAASLALEQQRRQFPAAYAAAKSGPEVRWRELAAGLETYPLYPYLEAAALDRELPRADAADVREFLTRHEGVPVAESLRRRWLVQLASRKQWSAFLDAWRAQDDAALRCLNAQARIATGRTADLAPDALALWLQAGSMPRECDPVIAWLRAQRLLTDARVWERIELAARARQAGLVRHLAGYLAGAERSHAQRWADALANPSDVLFKAAAWPDQPRTRQGVAIAFVALARRDVDRAAALWPPLSGHYAFDAAQRGEMLAAVALWKAAAYAPDAARWLAQVPAEAGDDALREWRVREAVARADWKAAIAASAALGPVQQTEPRWRWIRARALELDGQAGAAQAVFDALALEPGFHGFLAADRQGKPYTICPLEVGTDAATRARVAGLPALQRAFELWALDMPAPARREWDALARAASAQDRRVAVALAQERGWLDRGPLTLLAPDDLRYYSLRFPIGHLDTVRARAKQNGLDPGLVLGLIRSESAWVEDAHSHADARGLMQVLPSTGKPIARQLKLRYAGPADLYQPHVSIALGTRHLADVIARYDGRVWLALAAYNAGPAPVERWLAARGSLPHDLWVETIPWRETREYVGRVLAFATIYGWRIDGRTPSIAARIGLGEPATRQVACALDTPVAPVAASTRNRP